MPHDHGDLYSLFASMRRFGSLDGLRALAIAGVLWQHCAPIPHAAGPFTNAGASGVSLFFVLSGFLITTLLLREWRSTGRIDLSGFYWRRSLRIFPLYYATLAAYCVLVTLFEPDSAAGRGFFTNLPYFATYTNNWFCDWSPDANGEFRAIFIFAWSLATEEQFYLMWPPLLFLLGVRRAFWVLALLAVGDLALSAAVAPEGAPSTIGAQLVKIAASFSTEIATGCALAGLMHFRRTFGWFSKLLGGRWSVWLAAAAALAVITAWPVPTVGWRVAQSMAFGGLIGAAVIRPVHGLSWLFDNVVLARIGVVSYGMYLLHMISMHLATKAAGMAGWNLLEWPWLRISLTAMTAYAIAEMSFRWFESPILRLKSRTPWFGLGRPSECLKASA